MLFRLYNPQVFQGSLKKKNYFEGWYFKHVSSDLNTVLSFIPGISLNENSPHCFIQMLDGITGNSEYFKFPVSEFSWHRKDMFVRIGNSVFTDKYIILDIQQGKNSIKGRVEYSSLVRFPGKLLSPGIMGWYSFVPSMECKHGIVSVNHNLKGSIIINDKIFNFDKGKGYIEKDWGISFPESWIWLQANNFNDQRTCVSFSVAKIPWRRRFFLGFICFLYYNNCFYLFCTYNKSGITGLNHTQDCVSVTLHNRHNQLKIDCIKSHSGELKAPVSGTMSRAIKESIDATVNVVLSDKAGNIIYSDSSKRAGVEIIEKIFDYFELKNSDHMK